MPEGHTIHRELRRQAPALVGRPIDASSPNRRFGSGAAAIHGRTLESMEAWGKHLFYFFTGRRVLHVHLGMDGRFRHVPGPPGSGVWLRLAADGWSVDLSTPRICRLIDVVHQRRIVAALGPDPIRTDDDGGAVLPRLAAYDGPIGAALLDQSVVAGIGNISRAEILFAAGIHPDRPASSIDSAEWERIWAAAVGMLRAGVSEEPKAAVYQRRMCPRCGFPVRHWDLQGRQAWACEHCQPLSR